MKTFFYSRQGETVEMTIRDQSGRRIDSFKCNSKDRKAYNDILFILDSKYGFKLEIPYALKKRKSAKNQAEVIKEVNFLEMNNRFFDAG